MIQHPITFMTTMPVLQHSRREYLVDPSLHSRIDRSAWACYESAQKRAKSSSSILHLPAAERFPPPPGSLLRGGNAPSNMEIDGVVAFCLALCLASHLPAPSPLRLPPLPSPSRPTERAFTGFDLGRRC